MRDDLASVPYVMMYHSVSALAADPHHITVSPTRLGAHMRWLRRSGLRGVSMRELLDAAQSAPTHRLVGLTFDDGYADFNAQVMPVLDQYGFTATVFVVAGKLGGYNDWDADGPVKALMTIDQITEAARAGIEIGSHGMNHRNLAHAEPDVCKLEIQSSRDLLESQLGTTVDGFSYPYGELSDSALLATREAGYDYAVATWHMARRDRHALPRTYIGQRDWVARLVAKQLRHRLTWGGRR
jgi:peptidoglycan/xylan/chitin deacetylase (PgdA/CDA1 family)